MADSYRILVTGSRTWDDKDFIWDVLNGMVSELLNVTIVHGACPAGADAIAEGWVRHKLLHGEGITVRAERHPADWKRHGRAAGFRRNAEMVALGADACFAFIRNGSHGATHCAGLAEGAGIYTLRYTREDAAPDGAATTASR